MEKLSIRWKIRFWSIQFPCELQVSVIPLTTHINPKNIFKDISPTKIEKLLKIIFKSIKNKNYDLKFKDFKFLCYNPHCGEKSTLGLEEVTGVEKTNITILQAHGHTAQATGAKTKIPSSIKPMFNMEELQVSIQI